MGSSASMAGLQKGLRGHPWCCAWWERGGRVGGGRTGATQERACTGEGEGRGREGRECARAHRRALKKKKNRKGRKGGRPAEDGRNTNTPRMDCGLCSRLCLKEEGDGGGGWGGSVKEKGARKWGGGGSAPPGPPPRAARADAPRRAPRRAHGARPTTAAPPIWLAQTPAAHLRDSQKRSGARTPAPETEGGKKKKQGGGESCAALLV